MKLLKLNLILAAALFCSATVQAGPAQDLAQRYGEGFIAPIQKYARGEIASEAQMYRELCRLLGPSNLILYRFHSALEGYANVRNIPDGVVRAHILAYMASKGAMDEMLASVANLGVRAESDRSQQIAMSRVTADYLRGQGYTVPGFDFRRDDTQLLQLNSSMLYLRPGGDPTEIIELSGKIYDIKGGPGANYWVSASMAQDLRATGNAVRSMKRFNRRYTGIESCN